MKVFNEKSALIIIDMERAFVDPDGAFCIKGAASTIPSCAAAASEAREAGAKVIWVKRVYREDGSDVEFTRYDAWEKGGHPLAPGSVGVNSIEEPSGLERKEGDFVIIKPRWSAFFQTELDMVLRRLGITRVVLAGTTTPNCIRTTCYDAIALDYETVVLEKCCSSQTDEIQQANMEDMERVGAIIVR